MSHELCITKKLDGTFTWHAVIWFGDNMFEDCSINSSYGLRLQSEKEAIQNATETLKKLNIISK